jgi:hypothetical protein
VLRVRHTPRVFQAPGLVRSKTQRELEPTCKLPKGAQGEPKNGRSRQRGPRLVACGLLKGRRERASHVPLVLGRFSRSLERAACELVRLAALLICSMALSVASAIFSDKVFFPC